MVATFAPSRAAPLRPMLASLDEAPLVDERWVYEPKYDGIRALVEVGTAPAREVRIWSRRGNDKTRQFPEIVAAMAQLARRLRRPVLLDGEIVALDESDSPAGFQRLQGRIHRALTGTRDRSEPSQPVGFVAFDILRDGTEDLRPLPLTARRARLVRVLGNAGSPRLRLSDFVPGDGRALYRTAMEHGGEGLIAKHLDSPYLAGRRSPDWRKLKIQSTQSCVVGGWTEPRGSRPHFGALLLGLWGAEGLRYVGHTGAGFGQAELARVAARLRPLETESCPFATRPRTNERPHWTEPLLVAEVRFTEWTADGKLRQPTYLGLRDDLTAGDVQPERGGAIRRASSSVPGNASTPHASASGQGCELPVSPPRLGASSPGLARLCERLEQLEASGSAGTLTLPDGSPLEVSRLDKVLWRAVGITKGELMRYYVALSPCQLPAVADRPLIMRRYPNGIEARAFYQQRSPATVPPGVRALTLPGDRAVPGRLVGGSLLTLLYMVQLAVISQDPWFARVGSLDFPDHAVIDLDPMPGVSFGRVVDVLRWVHDELERLGVPSWPKTSGAEGAHVYVPLPPETSWESARLFSQVVAALVARQHPRHASVERSVSARGRTVYLDCLQNARGKSLATAYSARATSDAGASAPLRWDEVHAGVDRRDYTVRTLPARVAAVGDLWAPLAISVGADLDAVLERLRA
jgi:bifunctional non-homologous end joining protein LigD